MNETISGCSTSLLKCSSALVDTIIGFDQSVPHAARNVAAAKFRNKALCVVFGSSLAVEPANQLPTKCKSMVIVNLQPTPLDNQADLSFIRLAT